MIYRALRSIVASYDFVKDEDIPNYHFVFIDIQDLDNIQVKNEVIGLRELRKIAHDPMTQNLDKVVCVQREILPFLNIIAVDRRRVDNGN